MNSIIEKTEIKHGGNAEFKINRDMLQIEVNHKTNERIVLQLTKEEGRALLPLLLDWLGHPPTPPKNKEPRTAESFCNVQIGETFVMGKFKYRKTGKDEALIIDTQKSADYTFLGNRVRLSGFDQVYDREEGW